MTTEEKREIAQIVRDAVTCHAPKETKKVNRHTWFQTISIALAIVLSLLALTKEGSEPFRKIWDALNIIEVNQHKDRDEIKKLTHYMRQYHPETKRENNGFLDNPYPTRSIGINYKPYEPFMALPINKRNENMYIN